MAKVFNQHAHAGEYHLQTFYVDGQWDWQARAIRNSKLPEFTGTSQTPDGAKKAPANSIGLVMADWMPIGAAIEIPD